MISSTATILAGIAEIVSSKQSTVLDQILQDKEWKEVVEVGWSGGRGGGAAPSPSGPTFLA
jgi:hypothetical protein